MLFISLLFIVFFSRIIKLEYIDIVDKDTLTSVETATKNSIILILIFLEHFVYF